MKSETTIPFHGRSSTQSAAVFLDRDNTLIENNGDLGDPDKVKLIKGAASAIASLRGLGYQIVVVSNQGGVARGAFDEADVEAVHERLSELVKATSGSVIDRYYYCPYHPKGKVKKYRKEHPWRKPQPGMLLQAAEDLKLDLGRCWLIGDQLRDTAAAAAAGVRSILLADPKQAGKSEDDPSSGGAQAAGDGADIDSEAHGTSSKGDRESGGDVPACWVSPSIIDAVKIIAKQGRKDASTERPATTSPRREPVATAARHPEAVSAPVGSSTPTDHNPAPPSGTVQVSSRKPQAAKSRPFRPWMIQPVDEAPAADQDTPVDTPGTVKPVEVQVEPVQVVCPPNHPAGKTGPLSAAGATAPEPVAIPSPPRGTPLDKDEDMGTGSVVPSDQTLRQILHELRNQRASDGDFSYQHMVAIVLQMMAAVCLLGALWMGSSSLDLFVRWACVAMVMQLATIAILLFRR